jgi:hypothetical protein
MLQSRGGRGENAHRERLARQVSQCWQAVQQRHTVDNNDAFRPSVGSRAYFRRELCVQLCDAGPGHLHSSLRRLCGGRN